MLRKRNRRAGAFSTCHATVLAGFILLAHVLGLGPSEQGLRVSDVDAALPLQPSPIHRCAATTGTEITERSCALVTQVSQEGTRGLSIMIWTYGIRL